jgi:hypothetical protein
MEVKAVPYCLIAAFRASSSLANAVSPAEAQRPRRSDVLVSIAAGMAEIGSLVVPPCYAVRNAG